VTAVTKYIKQKIELDPHLQKVFIKGEISNFNHHSRGHMYLTIKDSKTQIKAVMFAGNNRNLKFTPENGMKVFITGNINVYEPFGQYQLYIKNMEPDGVGALYLAFEQLKEKLNKAGYFNEENKKTLPNYPEHIAIITSPTWADVRDILITLKNRYPIAKTTIIPTSVQGVLSTGSIVQAIERAININKFDCNIFGQCGGIIEDLWNFYVVFMYIYLYKNHISINRRYNKYICSNNYTIIN